jgi:hypothetical protein
LTRRDLLTYLGVLGVAAVLPLKLVELVSKSKRLQALKLVDCDWVLDNVFLIDGQGYFLAPGFI